MPPHPVGFHANEETCHRVKLYLKPPQTWYQSSQAQYLVLKQALLLVERVKFSVCLHTWNGSPRTMAALAAGRTTCHVRQLESHADNRLESLQGKRLAIDSSIWLYHFQMAMRDSEGRTLSNAHLLGFLWRILKLLFYGIKPIFVFDGGAPVQKRRTIANRKHRRTTATDSLAKTAEKLLAAQLRQAALNYASPQKQSGLDAELLDNGTVYFDSVGRSNQPQLGGRVNETGLTVKPALQPKSAPKDPYQLPDMPHDALLESKGQKDLRFATETELRALMNSIAPEDLDMNSELFRSLPPELQYELVGDLRMQSRGTSYKRLQDMLHAAPTAIDFSKAQVAALKTRNDLTQKVLTVTDEIGRANIQVPMRVEGLRNREYVLTHIDSGDGGFALGSRDAGTTRDKAIIVDSDDTKPDVAYYNHDDDEELAELDMEDVEIGSAPIAPDPELDAIVQAEPDPIARKERALQFLSARAEQHRRQKRKEAGMDDWEERMFGHMEPVQYESSALFHESDVGDAADAVEAAQPKDPILLDETFEEVSLPSALYAKPIRSRSPTPLPSPTPMPAELSASAISTAPPNASSSPPVALRGDEPAAQASATSVRSLPSQSTLRSPVPTVAPQAIVHPVQTASCENEWDPKHSESSREADSNVPRGSSSIPRVDTMESENASPTRLVSANNPKVTTGELDENDESHSAMARATNRHVDSLEVDSYVNVSDAYLAMPNAAPTSIPVTPRHDASNEPFHHKHEAASRDVSENKTREKSPVASNVVPLSSAPSSPERFETLRDASPLPERASSAFPWSPTPSPEPVPLGPDGFPLPTAEEVDDVENEEAHELGQLEGDQSEFADFLSTTTGQSLPAMRKEVEAEVDALRRERARLRRSDEEITQQMTAEIQALLRIFGLPYLTAPMEAEAQCAQLAMQHLVDGIITDDSDVFLFGGTPVYRNMFNNRRSVECYWMNDMHRELGLSRERLIQLAFLLGSDYTEGLPGVGPVLAMEILSLFPGDYALVHFREWWQHVQIGADDEVHDARSKVRRRIKRALRDKVHLSEEWPDPLVQQAYWEPQVDDSDEPFVWGQADLDAIRAFLQEYLRWPPSKTDQYVQPVMEQQRKTDRLRRVQATLDQAGFTGGRVPAPARSNAFESTRLQRVVQDFRYAQRTHETEPPNKRARSRPEPRAQRRRPRSGHSSDDDAYEPTSMRHRRPSSRSRGQTSSLHLSM